MKSRRSLGLAPFVVALVMGPLLAACSSDAPVTKPKPGDGSPLGVVDGLPVDDHLALDNLTGKVDLVRDKYGRPHIYATNVADAMRVEGYQAALDRTMQL